MLSPKMRIAHRDPNRMRLPRLVAGLACMLAAACATARPGVPSGRSAAPVVRLVDSLRYENDMSDGTHRRVEVRTAAGVDTLRGVRTFDLPVMMGDTMLRGLAYKDDRLAFGYEYDGRARPSDAFPFPAT
jgi:hypothetical protein